jgi:hypothetical protein
VTSPRGKKFLPKKYCCRKFFAAMQSHKDMLEDATGCFQNFVCAAEKGAEEMVFGSGGMV